jgi:hypothetical protein
LGAYLEGQGKTTHDHASFQNRVFCYHLSLLPPVRRTGLAATRVFDSINTQIVIGN